MTPRRKEEDGRTRIPSERSSSNTTTGATKAIFPQNRTSCCNNATQQTTYFSPYIRLFVTFPQGKMAM